MKSLLIIFLTLFSHTALGTNPEDAFKMTEEGRAIIVDVREFEEISHGMVKDALWFPKSRMAEDHEAVESFKDLVTGKKVFLYCEEGKRAAQCKGILRDYGIEAESIGGFKKLKKILPVEGLHQKLLRLRKSASLSSGRKNK